MKTQFTPKEIMSNRGCYSETDVEKLSFIGQSTISMVDILNSEINIKDKRWFLWNKGKLNLTQKKDLSFILAKIVSGIFNECYPNDSRINDCLQAIQNYRDGKIRITELRTKRDAAYAAAYAAADADAAYAAYAAAYAAADADADAAYAAAGAADRYKNTSYSEKLKIAMIEFVNENSKVKV